MADTNLGTMHVSLKVDGADLEKGTSQAMKRLKELQGSFNQLRNISLGVFAGTSAALAAATRAAGGKEAALVFAQVRDAANQVSKSFGEMVKTPILEMLTGLRDTLAGVSAWFQSLSPETQKWVGYLAIGVAAFAGLAAVLAQVASMLPSVILGFKAMGAVAAMVGSGILIPLAEVVVVIVGLITAIGALSLAWKKNAGGIRDITIKLADSISEIFGGLWDWLASSLKSVLDWARNIIYDVIGKIKGMSSEEIAKAKELENAKWAQGGRFEALAKDLWDDSADFVSDVGKEIKSAFKEGATLVAKGLKLVIPDSVFKAFENMGTTLTTTPYKSTMAPTSTSIQAATGAAAGMAAGAAIGGAYAGIGFDWVAATVDQDKAMAALTKGATEIGNAMLGFGQTLLQQAGFAGQLVMAGIEGFKSGGPWGAIIAVIAQLLTHASAFQAQMQATDKMLYELAEAFNPLIETLNPLANLVIIAGRMIGMLLKPFAVLGVALKMIEPLLRIVAEVIMAFTWITGKMVNAFIDSIKWLFDILGKLPGRLGRKFRKWSDQLEAAKVDTDEIERQMKETWQSDMTAMGESVKAAGQSMTDAMGSAILEFNRQVKAGGGAVGGSLSKAWDDFLKSQGMYTYDTLTNATDATAESMDGLGNAIDDATESLTNLPEGYKVAAARFAAIAPEAGVLPPELGGPYQGGLNQGPWATPGTSRLGGVPGGLGGLTGDPQVTNIGTVNINGVTDGAQFYDQFKRRASWDRFTQGGSTSNGLTGTFAPGFGGVR